MMTRGGEGGKKCPKFDDVICERPLIQIISSDPCEEGKYRSSGMTQCKECDPGKIPNSDKSDCSEWNSQTRLLADKKLLNPSIQQHINKSQ